MEFWEWFTLIGGIIGGVAFLMAVQPFTQFIWGRPKIKIDFTVRDKASSRYLDVLLSNAPIDNLVLKFLGVRRMTAEGVDLTFRVKDMRTQTWVEEEGIAELDTVRDEHKLQISLPGSLVPVSSTLIRATNNETSLVQGTEKMKLAPGKYEIELTVHCSETRIIKKRAFSVGTQPYDLFWE